VIEIPEVAALRAAWLTRAGRLPADAKAKLTPELLCELRRLAGRWKHLRNQAFEHAEVPEWRQWKHEVYETWQWRRYWPLAQRSWCWRKEGNQWVPNERYAAKRREAQKESIARRDAERAANKEAEAKRQHELYLKRKAKRLAVQQAEREAEAEEMAERLAETSHSDDPP